MSYEVDLNYLAEFDDGDRDSGYEEDREGSTRSLTASILEYQYENGRRYHAYRAGTYFMPNDDTEQTLMDYVHHLSLVVLGGNLFMAPIQEPRAVLDVGTGTGIWALDAADQFPGAHVIAVDLSPIQVAWVPPNLDFQICDCEDDWSFGTNFDFVHMRNMSGSIKDWPRLIGQALNSLYPLGWYESANVDVWFESNNNSLPEDSAVCKWRTLLFEASRLAGRELRQGRNMKQFMVDAGFVNVQTRVFHLPASPWMEGQANKEFATLLQNLMCLELEGISLALFTRVLNWDMDRLRALLSQVRKEIRNPAYQLYWNLHIVFGQRPAW